VCLRKILIGTLGLEFNTITHKTKLLTKF